MTVTSNDIANQAIQFIGANQPPVTGNAPNFDNSTAGVALSKIYVAAVQTAGRQFEWDMARKTIALTSSGNAPPFPWAKEYLYPVNGIEVWQVMPPSLTDPNNPLPTNWVVANAIVMGTQQRVIQTDIADAWAVYNNNPSEDCWDALFRETVVRLLASELAMAISGKPDVSQSFLDSGSSFAGLAKTRDS